MPELGAGVFVFREIRNDARCGFASGGASRILVVRALGFEIGCVSSLLFRTEFLAGRRFAYGLV